MIFVTSDNYRYFHTALHLLGISQNHPLRSSVFSVTVVVSVVAKSYFVL